MECLLLILLIVCVSPTLGLRCWSHFCQNGGFCIQQCSSNQTTCVASYIPVSGNDGNNDTLYRTAAGVLVRPLFIACSHTVTGGLCLEPTCNVQVSDADIHTCCCRGDLCNSIAGITPDTQPTAVPVPTGPIPTEHPGYVVCEAYNCTNADGTKAVDCFHGYQSCVADPAPFQDREFCQATYRKTSENLYQLYRKGCQSASSQLCDDRADCFVDTESGEQFVNCCCDSHLCNVNITASNPTLFVGAQPDECAELGCSHSCILHNGVPTCLCDAGYILTPDGKSCEDIDECASPITNPCGDICVNTVGGFNCKCRLGTRLTPDQHTCAETGLTCQSLTCNNRGCQQDGPDIQYCDDYPGSVSHCQATFRLMNDGSLAPRLQSCYNTIDESCSDNECILRPLSHSPELYFCCCNGHLCNDRIAFPNQSSITPFASTNFIYIPATVSPDHGVSFTSSVPLPSGLVTPVGAYPTSKVAFIVVCVVVVVIGVGASVIMCIFCRVCRKSRVLEPTIGTDLHDTSAAPILDGTDSTTFLEEKIGQGRFASVWKAILAGGHPVAVKVFQSHGKDSWQREIDIYQTADLQHKNILLFLSSEIRGTEHWLLTEYHPQGSLYDLLHRNTVSLAQFCIMAETAALGLAHLHSERIVGGVTRKPAIAHRDLKSKNILIRHDGQCVISDFGLAWRFQPGQSPSEAQGQVGTSRYMSPEVLEGAINFQRESFLRIDIYALALIMWEISSRTAILGATPPEYRPPFDDLVSQNPSLEEMREVVVTQQLRPTIPKGFINSDMDTVPQTIEESWDQDSEARLSAQCIAERIRSFRQSKPGAATFKDSGYLESAGPNHESLDSTQSPYTPQPTTPSMCSSFTMSPLEVKPPPLSPPQTHVEPQNSNDVKFSSGTLSNPPANIQRLSVSHLNLQQRQASTQLYSTETTV